MTCQHCQTQNCETQILDDDYRCRRCGSRVRSTPSRPASSRFPIETSATAHAYHVNQVFDVRPAATASTNPVLPLEESPAAPATPDDKQARLYKGSGSDARIIPFESLTTRAERQFIHARAEGLERPAPLKTERVQVKRARSRPAERAKRKDAAGKFQDQRRLEFNGEEDLLAPPVTSVICDAPVAPAALRLEATLIDAAIIALPCALSLVLFWLAGGSLDGQKSLLPLLLGSLATIPFFYKFLWVVAGCDTIGTRMAGLELIDFDGNPPSHSRRFLRLGGSLLSLFAAGIGLVWSLVDEDRLTWHDHISSTFPTFSADSKA